MISKLSTAVLRREMRLLGETGKHELSKFGEFELVVSSIDRRYYYVHASRFDMLVVVLLQEK